MFILHLFKLTFFSGLIFFILINPAYAKFLLWGVALENVSHGTGARVSRIKKGCDAEESGLNVGDIIVKINDLEVKSMYDIDGRILKDENLLEVVVKRNEAQLIFHIGEGPKEPVTPVQEQSESKNAVFYYEQALSFMKDRHYRMAANSFISSDKKEHNFKDAKKMAAEIYYQMGRYFLKDGFCKNAIKDFQNVLELFPFGYKDTSAKIDEAEQCASTCMGFFPFQVKVNTGIRGIAIDDVIFEGVKFKVDKGGSRHVKIIERERLQQLVNEQGLSLKGIVDGDDDFKKLKGIKYMIFGKINKIRLEKPQKSSRRKNITYQETITVKEPIDMPFVGRVMIDKNKTIDKNFSYTEHVDKLKVAIAGSISIQDIRGTVLLSLQINEKGYDKIIWADSPSVNPDNINIDFKTKKLFNSRQELKYQEDILDEVIDGITDKLSKHIL